MALKNKPCKVCKNVFRGKVSDTVCDDCTKLMKVKATIKASSEPVKEEKIEVISKQMVELSEMSKFLMEKLTNLQKSFDEISVKKEDISDETDLGDNKVNDSESEYLSDNPNIDPSILEPAVKLEELENDSELVSEVNDTIKEVEEDVDKEIVDLNEEEMEVIKEEKSPYEGVSKSEVKSVKSKNKQNKQNSGLNFQNSPIVPPGWSWKEKTSKEGKNIKNPIIYKSPHGRTFYTGLSAIQFMIKNRKMFTVIETEIMRMNLKFDGWKSESFLPKGWMICKYKKPNLQNGGGYYYLSDKLRLFESTKAATDFMKDQGFEHEEIEKLKFQVKTGKIMLGKDKYSWEEGGNSLPKGWKKRIAEGDGKYEFILSPGGAQYRSRFVAIQDMIKTKSSKNDVEEMKKYMVSHEGWEISPKLPRGWLFKKHFEGKKGVNVHYLSREGMVFESMKTLVDFLKNSKNYSSLDVKKAKEFLLELGQKASENRYDWIEGDDTLPRGWKFRMAEGDSEKEWILSPENVQYKTRFSAILDMVKRQYKQSEIDDMRLKLKHEGWEKHPCLPHGWRIKIWEGVVKGKLDRHYQFLSKEAQHFTSYKTVKEYLLESKLYSMKDVERIEQLQDNKSIELREKGNTWEENSESVPKGWKRRICEGESKIEFILSPTGAQYKSRYVAIQDIIKKGYREEEVEEMKSKMIEYEGWEESELLPKGWMYKVHWEGMTKDKKYSSNIYYLSKEGKSFESMKSALDFMTTSDEYSAEDLENGSQFLENRSKETIGIRFNWTKSPTVPDGWKVRKADGTGNFEYILSPSGVQYRSRYVAIQDLATKKASKIEMDEMRSKMILYENWEISEYLPEDWLFKVNWEGKCKDRWSSNILYISKEGCSFESMKSVMDFMQASSNYNYEDIENCKIFLKQRGQMTAESRFDWKTSDTVPAGWKTRSASGKSETEFILSPSGDAFKSRFVAVKDMIKKGAREDEINEMRKKMIEHEGWELSDLLPFGWMFKVHWEGMCRDNKWSSNLFYLSREGCAYESMKGVTDFMISSSSYTEEDVRKCKTFLKQRNQETADKRFEWKISDTVPSGWKTRIADGKKEAEYILSPNGDTFKSRFVAIKDMIKNKASRREVEEMKKKMIAHEAWEVSDLLPKGWLFKVNWEGYCKDKWSSNILFLSKEGTSYESMKTATEFMESSKKYTPGDILKAKKFLTLRNQETTSTRYTWSESDTVPEGWKTRIAEGSSKMEFIMSPNGVQYKSRFVAIQDMVNSPEFYSKENVAAMKEKLIAHESWQISEFLPEGWLFKIAWEGHARTKMTLQTNTLFLSREGCAFESLKSAVNFIESAEGYSFQDVEGCKLFQINQRKTKAKVKFDWEEGDESLPEGWFKRIAEGNSQTEYILSPEGVQFKTRFSAIQNMFKTEADPLIIEQMREKLTFEGWESIALLPAGWMFKRAFEGTDARGRIISNTLYLSKEGSVFESAKAAVDFMLSCGYYSEQDVYNFKEFQSMLCKVTTKKRDDWEEDTETLPQGWKKRLTNKTEYFLRPDGKQFKSRSIALQTMVQDGYEKDVIEEMRSKLCYEGWQDDKLFPKGWLFKKWEGLVKNKVDTSYQYLSYEGVVFKSMSTAVQFMRESGQYTQEQIMKFQKFVKKENRSSISTRFSWSEDDQLPSGWKSRISDGSEGRKYFLMPDGNQFPSLFSALQFMVKEQYPPADIAQLRNCLKQEGWEYDPLLPTGWQCKITKEKNYYIGRNGEYFTSAKKAYEFLTESSDYTMEDVDGIKDKMEQETKSKVPDKYNWKQYDNLPLGWKIRKMKNKSNKMVEYFLAPDGKHIRGRNSSMEYMRQHGYSEEDINKVKTFRWFGNTSVKQEIKKENAVEADEIRNEQLNDNGHGDNEINSLKDEDDDEYPLVTSTTEDEAQYDVAVSNSMDCDEEISDDEDNPVMAEFLDKITREMSSSNPALMNNITQIYADMKKSFKVKGGQKRSAISEHEDQSQAKRRSV